MEQIALTLVRGQRRSEGRASFELAVVVLAQLAAQLLELLALRLLGRRSRLRLLALLGQRRLEAVAQALDEHLAFMDDGVLGLDHLA